VEVNATFPGAFHRLSAAIVVSFSAHPLSAVLQYKFIMLFTFIDLFHKVHSHHIFTFLSLPQFWASPVIFTNWGKQGVTIAFASIKISDPEKKYNTTEREGLAMVYALQKFKHYLLGKHFKMFNDHSSLKYLVKKKVLGGRICRWLLLFQEFDYEVIVNPGKLNAGPNHLSRVTNGKEPTNLEDNFPDAQLFSVQIVMKTS
jgi:hypothetical protein